MHPCYIYGGTGIPPRIRGTTSHGFGGTKNTEPSAPCVTIKGPPQKHNAEDRPYASIGLGCHEAGNWDT